MKNLVLSALVFATTVGNSMANTTMETATYEIADNTEIRDEQKRIDAFKQQLAFHQRNVDVFWNQYNLEETRIKNSRGSHTDLDSDKAFFLGVYQQDIAKGIRVEESKKAMTEIEATYAQKHAEREAYEGKRIALLQAHLKAELKKEQKKFEKVKKNNAQLVNDETLSLLHEVAQYFAQSIKRVEKMAANDDQEAIVAL
ncbi:hypothetical protein [Parapedobacter tibetensis]|uniref:hypothetical protein n=1 Tax=Parapedobacter tibetensis TaxID=2972951 RepID=UPI00214D9A64|nr:hypothetical protein [Parapedobacter tibetensis]